MEKIEKNIKLVYSYDGSLYYGLQRQPNKKTVQGEIEKILKTITREEINLITAGRTDRGVHAHMQVSNFFTFSTIPAEKIKYILNRSLPKDIYIKSVEEVDINFNARYDAKYREYVYIISWKRNPFESRYSKFYPEKIDINRLEKILKKFEGIKDFKNFRLNDCVSKTTIREIKNISVENFEEGKIKIRIKGSSFLKSQVRIIIGTALDVYEGKCDENYIEKLFSDFSREYKKTLVEACGLYLNEIIY